jgi:predicted RNase H-like HicB family nuclease
MTNKTNKALNEYIRLPYTVVLRRDEEGDVIARIKEFEGCVADGQDEMEALSNLEHVKAMWITACLNAGTTVPLPEDEEDLPSGKWLQRVPRSLHKKLTETAEREGVSLNQLVTSILAEAVGRRSEAENKRRLGETNTLTTVRAVAYEPAPYRPRLALIHPSGRSSPVESPQSIEFAAQQVPYNKKRFDIEQLTFQRTASGY